MTAKPDTLEPEWRTRARRAKVELADLAKQQNDMSLTVHVDDSTATKPKKEKHP
jgi:hypothetical protein